MSALVNLVPTETAVGNPTLNIAIFIVFVLITLAIVIKVSRGNKGAAEYYAGGRAFTGRQNGIAISGDYLSAASFLGIAGAIALNGYDGFLYSIGFLVAWLVALLLVAELLRNVGKYTMADVLSFRLRQRPVRIAAAISTLAVSFFYLLAQMAGAGGLVALLLGIDSTLGQRVVVGIVGVIMIFYVIYGGMKGTTWVQIIKAVLLIAGAALMFIWVLSMFGFNLSNLIGAANETTANDLGTARDLTQPGLQYKNPIDFISLSMALVLGTAGLPHVLMRFYTVPTSREARRSVVWAIWLIGLFYLFTLVLGFGAAQMLGPSEIKNAPGGANSAAPLLAFELGGEVFLGIISGVAFATILAVVAGLTITASASLSHDIYNTVV
ncbi:MAG TPA: cation acetate symporter, partial [Intrasporangium sp.]|nr:cation acetate symporter [Intrasporangium sp.]